MSKLQSSTRMIPKVMFVLGGPGAGKGTQCQKIVENYGFVHLSAGELLRKEQAKPGSEFGKLIDSHIREGTIVPVDITCSLLERAMKESDKDKFFIDGFPRNQDNLDGWNQKFSKTVNLLLVLHIDCPVEVCIERCLSRGEAGSGRTDDNMESLRKRIDTYNIQTKPIIEYYKKRQMVHQIDGSKLPNEVFEDVKTILNGLAARGDI